MASNKHTCWQASDFRRFPVCFCGWSAGLLLLARFYQCTTRSSRLSHVGQLPSRKNHLAGCNCPARRGTAPSKLAVTQSVSQLACLPGHFRAVDSDQLGVQLAAADTVSVLSALNTSATPVRKAGPVASISAREYCCLALEARGSLPRLHPVAPGVLPQQGAGRSPELGTTDSGRVEEYKFSLNAWRRSLRAA